MRKLARVRVGDCLNATIDVDCDYDYVSDAFRYMEIDDGKVGVDGGFGGTDVWGMFGLFYDERV